MYLADDVEGGETALPLAVGIDPPAQKARIASPSECVTKGSGIAVVPHKGDALLFFDLDVEGRAGDRAALHASCPTTKGTKWTATKWCVWAAFCRQEGACVACVPPAPE
jgi:prolyl 4-hydroxylase